MSVPGTAGFYAAEALFVTRPIAGAFPAFTAPAVLLPALRRLLGQRAVRRVELPLA